MAAIDIPLELVPHVQRLEVDQNDYEANKAIAWFLSSKPDTYLQSKDFLTRALAHNRTDDGDHQRMLEVLSEALIHQGEFADAFRPLTVLYSSYATKLEHVVHLAGTSFKTGQVDMATNVVNRIVTYLYDSAKQESLSSGRPICQVLEPANILRSHFGELAVKLDLYAKARVLGLVPDVRALLPVLENEVVNGCLYECVKESLSGVIEFPTDSEERNAWLAGYRGRHYLDFYVDGAGRGLDMNHFFVPVQRQWEESGRGPLIKMPDKYKDKGRTLLHCHGMPEDAWFVSFHARSGGFRTEVLSGLTHYRNSDIEDYVPAMKAVRDRGGWVVRLGDASMPPLPEMDGVIDYAVSDWRADWIDVFLLAQNRFFVGVPSGPIAVAQAFGVPIVGVNWFPFEDWLYASNVITIFKLYRRQTEGGYLSVSEMANPPVRGLFSKRSFDARGIEVENNSPEDIRAAVVEMMDQLDGGSGYSNEDEDLQQRFKALADPFDVGVNIRFGRDFLGRHHCLLA